MRGIRRWWRRLHWLLKGLFILNIPWILVFILFGWKGLTAALKGMNDQAGRLSGIFAPTPVAATAEPASHMEGAANPQFTPTILIPTEGTEVTEPLPEEVPTDTPIDTPVPEVVEPVPTPTIDPVTYWRQQAFYIQVAPAQGPSGNDKTGCVQGEVNLANGSAPAEIIVSFEHRLDPDSQPVQPDAEGKLPGRAITIPAGEHLYQQCDLAPGTWAGAIYSIGGSSPDTDTSTEVPIGRGEITVVNWEPK